MAREDNDKPVGGAWVEQQKEGLEKQEAALASAERRPALSDEEQRKLEDEVARETEQTDESDTDESDTNEGDPGDDRTPGETIGQVAYADGQKLGGGR